MTKLDQVRLSEALDACIAELRPQGRFFVREITALVKTRYPQVVAEASERLLDEALAAMTRNRLKAPKPTNNYQQPLPLPPEIASLGISDAFSLLPTEGDFGEEDRWPWTTFYAATLADIDQHIRVLREKGRQNAATVKAFRQLRAYVTPIMGNRPHDPIGPVLEEMGRQREGEAQD